MEVLREADFLVNNLEDCQSTDPEELGVRLPDFTKLLESVQTTLVDPSRCRILAGLNIRKSGTASFRLCTSDCCGQPVPCDRISVAIWGPRTGLNACAPVVFSPRKHAVIRVN